MLPMFAPITSKGARLRNFIRQTETRRHEACKVRERDALCDRIGAALAERTHDPEPLSTPSSSQELSKSALKWKRQADCRQKLFIGASHANRPTEPVQGASDDKKRRWRRDLAAYNQHSEPTFKPTKLNFE